MSAPTPGKRTITIDSSLQAFSKRSGKNKHKSAKINPGDALKPKLKPNQFIRPSTLKKQLLARIKNHQKKHAQTSSLTASAASATQTHSRPLTSGAVTTPTVAANAVPAIPASATASHSQNETFTQSLEYLQSLAANSRDNRHNKQRHKNKTQRTNNVNLSVSNSNSNNGIGHGGIGDHSPGIATASSSMGPMPLPMSMSMSSAADTSSTQPQVFLDAFPSQQPQMYNNIVMPPAAAAPFSEVSPINSFLSPPSPSPFPQSQVMLNDEPRWGCLKSGSKPTFRTFHNKTLKTNTASYDAVNPISNPVAVTIHADADTTRHVDDSGSSDASNNNNNNNNSNNNNNNNNNNTENETEPTSNAVALSESLYGTRQQRLDEYRQEQIKAEKKTVEPIIKIKQTKQHIITKKYKLGKYTNKSGPVIGVLIKNIQTQRNVEKKRNELRRVPLDTVVSRLHKKRLLKVGSTAPPDILREMYESAVMAGDIENEGNDIAMHNFLSGTGTGDDANLHST